MSTTVTSFTLSLITSRGNIHNDVELRSIVKNDDDKNVVNSQDITSLISALETKKAYLLEQEAISDITDNTLYYFPKNKWYFMSVVSAGVVSFIRCDKMGNRTGDTYNASGLPVSSLRRVSKQPSKFHR